MIKSQALEANIASYQVDVVIDPRYEVIQEVMSCYYGLREGLTLFLKELSHPYKNWQFIVTEARGYALDYFHVLKSHAQGPRAAALFIEIFESAVWTTKNNAVRADAVDNLLLFLQKIIKETDSEINRFMPVLDSTFKRICEYEDRYFFLFVKSFYQIKRLGEALLTHCAADEKQSQNFSNLWQKYFEYTYRYWLSTDDPWTWFRKEAEFKKPDETIRSIFDDISHRMIESGQTSLEQAMQAKQDDTRK